jgi:hypothetical protein
MSDYDARVKDTCDTDLSTRHGIKQKLAFQAQVSEAVMILASIKSVLYCAIFGP